MLSIWKSMKIFALFINYQHWNIMGYQSSFSLKTRPPIPSQSCRCWWSGKPRRQGINSHYVDLLLSEYSSFSTEKTEGWFNIKMTSYQYRKSHCGDKTILTIGFPILVRWHFILNQAPEVRVISSRTRRVNLAGAVCLMILSICPGFNVLPGWCSLSNIV